MQTRTLRPFEQGAHLHVLDWAHDTARYRFQAAGATQVKAAARAYVNAPANAAPPVELPSLQAAVHRELRNLYMIGHATVRSELDHQHTGSRLPVGLSAAPTPPNLRIATGAARRCGTCRMFDNGACWGYGNYGVEPDEVCDSWASETTKTLATHTLSAADPGRLVARARVIAQSAAHAIWQAIQRARLQGITDRRTLRAIGRQAGNGALSQAASHHTGGAISAGRRAAALLAAPPQSRIIGARYTSVLDKNTCGPCRDADTGELIALNDSRWIATPNPACLGGGRCRCIHVYQLSTETRDVPQPIAAGR